MSRIACQKLLYSNIEKIQFLFELTLFSFSFLVFFFPFRFSYPLHSPFRSFFHSFFVYLILFGIHSILVILFRWMLDVGWYNTLFTAIYYISSFRLHAHPLKPTAHNHPHIIHHVPCHGMPRRTTSRCAVQRSARSAHTHTHTHSASKDYRLSI